MICALSIKLLPDLSTLYVADHRQSDCMPVMIPSFFSSGEAVITVTYREDRARIAMMAPGGRQSGSG
jgi:hypothetical protein